MVAIMEEVECPDRNGSTFTAPPAAVTHSPPAMSSRPVIAALHQHIRAYPADQALRRVFRERHHPVHRRQRGQHGHAGVERVDRAGLALQAAHRGVVVHRHDQAVAGAHAPAAGRSHGGMQDVEDAVGHDDALAAARAPAPPGPPGSSSETAPVWIGRCCSIAATSSAGDTVAVPSLPTHDVRHPGWTAPPPRASPRRRQRAASTATYGIAGAGDVVHPRCPGGQVNRGMAALQQAHALLRCGSPGGRRDRAPSRRRSPWRRDRHRRRPLRPPPRTPTGSGVNSVAPR